MKSLLFFGDSNTYGYDPRGYFADRYPKNVRWADRLAAELKEEWNIISDGMNGRTIPSASYSRQYVLSLLQGNNGDPGIDLFAVMLGTNDLFSSYPEFSADEAAEKMESFLNFLSENVPEIRILLIAPPAVGSNVSGIPEEQLLHRESLRLGQLYGEIAEQRNLPFINTAEWSIPLAFDNVHLSAEGHRVFAEEMKQALRKL